jgi:uncharacterized protein YndB with AHSA1/START domain
MATKISDQQVGERPVGQVQDGTFEIGARRTFRSSPSRAWELIATREGAEAWLGDAPTEWWHGAAGGGPEAGDILVTQAGEEYEVRSIAPGTRIRLRTLGPLLPRTTIQLTVVPDRGRSVIALHQEGMPDGDMREPMREHWQRALDRIATLLDED